MSEQLMVKTIQFSPIHKMVEKYVDINNFDNKFHIISGPCAVEDAEQMEKIAKVLVKNNLKIIRGGLFKPRTSPYAFQGLQQNGYKLLKDVCEKYSLINVSEILDTRDVEEAINYIDIIQIGSRNMHNTSLLKEVGKTNKVILLKRGMMSTLKEFLLAAEYIVSSGNRNVILCERGIRTFEDSTRNTLDISSVAIIKRETTLPVIVDLSHSLGRKDILLPVSKAVKALGADGLMIEVHSNPSKALSDEKQQLSIEEFQNFYEEFQD